MQFDAPSPHSIDAQQAVDERLAGALAWYRFGLNVIPVLVGEKRPAVTHDEWRSSLSETTINRMWARKPEADVGFILDARLLALDADTESAVAALKKLEAEHHLQSPLVTKTRRGLHHFYRLADGVFARTDSHDTETHPHRIDVKTEGGLVLLPPSTNKSQLRKEIDHVKKLPEVSQVFVDAVFAHNGRPAPRPYEQRSSPVTNGPASLQALSELKRTLSKIDPDCGYTDWVQCLMAVFHESHAASEGLAIADDWSSRGAKYRGFAEVQAKWNSFDLNAERVTVASLVRLAGSQYSNDSDAAKLAANEAIKRVQRGDVGAPFEPLVLAYLAALRRSDQAELQRYRLRLKDANKSVSLIALDREVQALAKTGSNGLQVAPTHNAYALDALNELVVDGHPAVSYQGDLYVVGESNLWVKHPVSQLERLVTSRHDGKDNCSKRIDYRSICEQAMVQAEDAEFFSCAPVGIACNGMFYSVQGDEVKSVPLEPDHRQRVMLNFMPVEQPTPLFDTFLHETFKSDVEGEEEQQRRLIQEIAGAMMMGLTARYQKAVLWYDPYGRAGKGALQSILVNLVPDEFVTAVSPVHWGKEYYIVTLAGARLNVVGELPDDMPIPAAEFKSVLGRDLLIGRHPTHRPVSFKNEATHLFMSNHMIGTRDHSEAFYSRWLLLEFPNSLLKSGRPVDPGLADRIVASEMPGITAWALKGAARLLKQNKFSSSIVHDRMMEAWRRSSSSLEEFLHECCDFGADEKVSRADLYKDYADWCSSNGRKPYAKGKVKTMLEYNAKLGIRLASLDGNEIFRGVDLKTSRGAKLKKLEAEFS